MINLQSRQRRSGTPLAAGSHVLSVSWMGRRFRALSVHRGQVLGTWESPEPVEGTDNFGTLIKRAIEGTRYAGDAVSLVLSHPRLAHQVIDLPPAKGPEIRGLIERTAQQRSASLFNTKAAWSAQPAESVKGTARYVVNLFPQPLLDELIKGARDGGVFLTSVLPPTAILHNQLQELPTKEAEVAMLVADTGGSTTVLVGYSDGRVLLARSLPGNWNESLPTLALDLRRTMLFVNQQHSVDIQSLFLFGPDAAERAAEVQAQVGLPTRASPAAWVDDYWALEGLRVQDGAAQNFISRKDQAAPLRRRRAWVIGVFTGLVVVISALASLHLHRMRGTEFRNLAELNESNIRLQVRHRELQEQVADVARRRDFANLVEAGRAPSLAAWVLGYLSEAVPPNLVLTNVVIRRQGEWWDVRLEGQTQPGATADGGVSPEESIEQLAGRLGGPPLRMALTARSTSVPPPAPQPSGLLPAALPDLIGRLAGATARNTVTNSDTRFALEGKVKL